MIKVTGHHLVANKTSTNRTQRPSRGQRAWATRGHLAFCRNVEQQDGAHHFVQSTGAYPITVPVRLLFGAFSVPCGAFSVPCGAS
jgi:hypothetical protein